MESANSISPPDRDLVRRLSVLVALTFVFAAGFCHLQRQYEEKFFGNTGQAQWIWAQHPLTSDTPVAIFATRNFTLPAQPYFARLKVFGDPEYTVYLNGSEIAGKRTGGKARLHVYDVSHAIRTGANRIVISVRAPHGVGGVIAALDLAPESRNWFGTGEEWRIYRRWSPLLLHRDPPGLSSERPLILGEPPAGRWNYLESEKADVWKVKDKLIEPARSLPFTGAIPRIRVSSGVSVAVAEKRRGVIFDFGFVEGQVRLISETPAARTRSIDIRLVHELDELSGIDWTIRQVVFAPGEQEVTIPDTEQFRYVAVYGKGVRAKVVRRGT